MLHFLGQKHQHERKFKSPKDTPYIRFLDKLTFIVGIIGPFTVLPQIISIYSTHNASGVSVWTWALIFTVTLPWVFYGIAHRSITIIISFTLWEFMNAAVAIGVLLYC
jgi:uncharacterized protein with PQ loop repeat